MILNKIDQLGIYLLGVLTIVFIMLAINFIATIANKKTLIKNHQILLFTIIFSLVSILIFKVDWNFEGELKDGRITKELLGLMLILCNLIALLLVGIMQLLNRIAT